MDISNTVPMSAVEEEARRLYDACHPDDSFADLTHRATFSKEDRLLLRDWRASVAASLADGYDQ